jgi:hypothetical protein
VRDGNCSDNLTKAAPTGQEAEARFVKRYPLGGSDVALGDSFDDGSGAAALRTPSGYLRWHEIQDANHGPILHALNGVGTRQAANGDPAKPASHLLSKYRVWPALSRDGGTDGADATGNNEGPFPYGCRLFIPPTTANKNRRSDPAYCENNRQRRLYDCLMYFGIYLVDGHGRSVNSGNGGSLRIRIDPLIEDGVKTDLLRLLARIASDNLLRPLRNIRRYASETERFTTSPAGGFGDQQCFAGGGGPIDSNSVNNAYDA